jgi:S-adenosylmethionine:tRNA ribosyltransferase-isomerase
LKKQDFYYDLPQELIAQTPLEDRSASRLMVLDKETGEVCHKHFTDILDYLNPGDTLVLNDTKVIPARLYGVKAETGGAIEFLLLKKMAADQQWEVILRPGRKAREGSEFLFGNGRLRAKVLKVKEDGNRIVEFFCEEDFETLLDEIGKMPLPHYITEELKDKDRYQTVYSKNKGSAAAPTAGLHFTKELLLKVEEKGINLAYVTLHVGLGTFRPVKEDDILDHKMHTEEYRITPEVADMINKTKAAGKRVISVGTTSTRVLESVGDENGHVHAQSGQTDIFIYPGYRYKIVDALITNFHLPESTLIMLVSALAGRDHVLAAYEEAVRERYRFFSFGDAMYIG